MLFERCTPERKDMAIERFSIAFTANGKRQAEISRLPKTREIYLVSAYILPVSHSYGASTKNREISWNKIIFLLLRQAAASRLTLATLATLHVEVVSHTKSYIWTFYKDK